MKKNFTGAVAMLALLAFTMAGCGHLPGKPKFRAETMRPDQVHDFAVLYKSNCSACHGDDGQNGAALPLNNPVYLQWAGHDRMIAIVTNGVPGRLMPAFGPGGGGLLTDRQVEDIVNGMISHWGKPDALAGADVPAYSPPAAGNAAQGKAAFQTYCARCHGADGTGMSRGNSATAPTGVAGSIVDPAYLSLISRQGLRDIAVAGMPGENMPDWRNDGTGRPMTDKEVTDIIAWLVSHRVQFPGQPFSAEKSPARDPSQTSARSQH